MSVGNEIPRSRDRVDLQTRFEQVVLNLDIPGDWGHVVRSDLGILGFGELQSILALATIELVDAVKVIDKTAPNIVLRAVVELYDQLDRLVKKIRDIDPEAPGFADARKVIINEIPSTLSPALERFYDCMSTIEMVRIKEQMLSSEAGKETYAIAISSVNEHFQEIENRLESAKKLDDELRAKAAEVVTSKAGGPVENARDFHLAVCIYSSVAAAALLITAGIFAQIGAGSISEQTLTVLMYLKAFGLPIAISVVAVVALKVAFASYHNFIINRHRKYIVESLPLALSTIKTDIAKDVILAQIYGVAATHQGTGFSKTPVESGLANTAVTQILEAIDSK